MTLPFAALTVRLVRDYEHYLMSLGNCDITIHKKLSFIKTVLLWAVEEGVLATEKNRSTASSCTRGRPGKGQAQRRRSGPLRSPASRAYECRPKWLALLPRVEAATALVNKWLKVVAALAGIEKVMTTHTARHSFADRGRRLGLLAADMLNYHRIFQPEKYFAEPKRSELSQKAVGIYARV